jgi:transposase InsO family protein
VKRLVDLCQSVGPVPRSGRRRGLARQQARRRREHALRHDLVALRLWTAQRGWTLGETADRLHLAPRTLRQWQHDHRFAYTQPALGRPTARASRTERQAVLEILEELGPGVGVPTLKACCPNLARAELADFLRRYRRVWRQRHQETLHVLRWQEPGRVWALDYAEPPLPIDGRYRALLAVRDLSSGRQLLWLPVPEPTASQATSALGSLFVVYGAPLVLKSDNGSSFSAEAARAFLTSAGVIPLFSPPYTPRYNGSIEAGIGSLKTRTERHATRQGHPGYWTWDDVEAARAEANATARPLGPSGPTPDALWNARRPPTPEERRLFAATVAQRRTEQRSQQEKTKEGSLSFNEEATIERQALRRALEEHAYLLYSRRRIPLPIPRRKAANIT